MTTTPVKKDGTPPVFHGDEGESYLDWRLDVELWQGFTSLEKKKWATSFLLNLKEGKVKSTVRGLGKEKLQTEDGLKNVIDALDKIYKEDDSAYIYRALRKFESYVRPKDMPLSSYVSEFNKMISEMESYKIKMPDCAIAYRFLNSANLPTEKLDLALATVKSMTYADMLIAVKKIFSVNINTAESSDGEIQIKSEPEDCFVSGLEGSSRGWRRGSRGVSDGHRGRSVERRGRGRAPTRGRSLSLPRGRSNMPLRGRSVSASRRPNAGYTGCFRCESMDHFARDCPEESSQSNQYFTTIKDDEIKEKEEEVAYITLIERSSEDVLSLVHETLACAVVDSGCLRTCAGENWVECYKETLSEEQMKQVTTKECDTPFRFGDGDIMRAKSLVTLPARVGKRDVLIETSVLDLELPLLLSKGALQKAKAVLDFENNTIKFAGEILNLRETSSGHYALPLCNRKRMMSGPDSPGKPKLKLHPMLVLAASQGPILGDEDKEVRKKVTKLHRQFSHCTSIQLKNLLKSAGVNDEQYNKIIDEISENCEICLKYKKVKPRPVVGLPCGRYFNDIVAMDLKKLHDECTILHMIDMATRYSSAGIVKNKDKTTVVKEIFVKWISIFGTPNKFMADNGGEFANSEYVDLCENINIETQFSAAESPFSNGMVERHHVVLAQTVLKTKEDMNCSWEVALAWGLNAKNSLQMFGGYSSYQLAMGRNPPLPNVVDDKLPALEGTTSSKVVAENLSAMHKAREEFIKCESNNKIRKALRSQVRTCNDDFFNINDKVYYKRRRDNKWHGPAVVVGRDSHAYLVKHSYRYCVVHPRDMQLYRATINDTVAAGQSPAQPSKNMNSAESEAVVSETIRAQVTTFPEMMPTIQEELSSTAIENKSNDNNNEGTQNAHMKRTLVPKPKTHVQFLPKDENEWRTAYIHSRAGKATGKYRNCVNIQLQGESEIIDVDWSEFASEWKEVDGSPDKTNSEQQPTITVLLTGSPEMYDQRVLDAKDKELQKLKDRKVYEEVLDEGQPTVSVRWVTTVKPDGTVKCRLVGRGYEENAESIRTDSPTCSRDTLRVLMSIVVGIGWTIQHIDVESAFLQGKQLDREVYIRPPLEAETNVLWKLNKCLYGLKDAPRMWFVELSETLESFGMEVSLYDESFLFWRKEGKLHGVMGVHVDDFLNGGSKEFQKKILQPLKEKFTLSMEVEGNFLYTGLEINQKRDCLELSQNAYIHELMNIHISRERANDNKLPITKMEYKELRSVCGQLLWVSSQTRPDIAYQTCVASNSTSAATIGDLKNVNKAMNYMKKNPLTLIYPKLDLNDLNIVVFCDAAYANLRDGSSQGAHLVFLASRNGKVCPLAWQSKKIKRLVKSSLSGESWAMIEAVESAELLKAMIQEITQVPDIPIVCMTDCNSLYNELHTSNTIEDKGLRVPIGGLRRKVKNNEFTVKWITKDLQLADPLTKAGAPNKELRGVLATGMLPDYILDQVFL